MFYWIVHPIHFLYIGNEEGGESTVPLVHAHAALTKALAIWITIAVTVAVLQVRLAIRLHFHGNVKFVNESHRWAIEHRSKQYKMLSWWAQRILVFIECNVL